MSICFIGVDAGGTQTRALLATDVGVVLGSGRAAGANSWSSGTSVAENITTAVREAIGTSDPSEVAGGVVAIAGGGAGDPEIVAEIDARWGGLALSGSPRLVIDVVAAYAAGTVAPRGLVLAAGTGSIAASVRDGQLRRRSGGHGWRVGDEGSAVWLGVEGIRAVLKWLDGRGPETALGAMVCEAFGIDLSDPEATAAEIVIATYSRAPAQLGQLAPLVIDASAGGDRVATRLVETAAEHLIELAVAVMGDEHPPVIVLAGSLLTQAAPIRRLVRAGFARRWPAASMVEAASGEAGAVALAITHHAGAPIPDAILSRLRTGSGGAEHQE